MLKTVGRQEEGVAAYRKAIALRPSLGEAWWSLANLKTVKFSDADIVAMQTAIETPGLAVEDRIHLEFALGKAMHDLGRTDEAFTHYERGNALRLKSRPYRSRDIAGIVDRCIEQELRRRSRSVAAAATRAIPFSSSACRGRGRP